MKVTKNGQSKDFNPYTINIQILSQDDEDVLSGLGKSNITLPDMLKKQRKVNSDATYSFCQQLNSIYGNN